MAVTTKIPLSAAIIAKNEGHNLPGCLESIQFIDQIVLVDSGSSDNTVEVARDYGCEVL